MHKFWVIAVGCALSVGTGVASDPDQVDERAANSDEVVFGVKVPDLGHEQSATVELRPSLQRGNLVEVEARLIRLEGNKYSLDLGADWRGVIDMRQMKHQLGEGADMIPLRTVDERMFR